MEDPHWGLIIYSEERRQVVFFGVQRGPLWNFFPQSFEEQPMVNLSTSQRPRVARFNLSTSCSEKEYSVNLPF